jgi:3-oxoadipate enol-lactonase
MPFMDLDTGRLHYQDQGQGPPLVLLHGAWASHRWWRWQVPELSKFHRVLAVDVRGHGLSSPLEKKSSIKSLASDMDRLLEGLGIPNAVLVGWSMGGLIALQCALDYPAKVAGLVLIATRGHRSRAMKIRILTDYLRAILDSMTLLAAPRKYKPGRERESPDLEPLYRREAARMLAPDAPKEVFEWVVSDLMANPRENYLTIARSIWNWAPGKRLAAIKAPALILVGQEDVMTPPRFSILLDKALPDSRLIVIPGATHYLALEKPEKVNAGIHAFLKEIDYR